MITPLTDGERRAVVERLPLWTYNLARRALFRSLQFEDFSGAIGTMMRIALEAERQDHHPDWSNVYNRVDIWLTTHDAGDISQRDLDLAEAIDRIVGRQDD